MVKKSKLFHSVLFVISVLARQFRDFSRVADNTDISTPWTVEHKTVLFVICTGQADGSTQLHVIDIGYYFCRCSMLEPVHQPSYTLPTIPKEEERTGSQALYWSREMASSEVAVHSGP